MAEAIDHLAGKTGYTEKLLAELTDTELEEQIAYYSERRTWYINHPDEVKPKSHYTSHAYAAYRFGNWVGMAENERAHRQP